MGEHYPRRCCDVYLAQNFPKTAGNPWGGLLGVFIEVCYGKWHCYSIDDLLHHDLSKIKETHGKSWVIL